MSRTDPTILVVDDDPDIVRVTRHVLTEAGLTVVTAGTAADALALARSLRPALLLLDVNLPDGNGVDVARQLKSDPDLADTFVVMASSGRVTTEDQAAGLDQGLADGYIVRPIANAELLARIHAFLRLHQAQTDLRAALREKDALVREVHHRVKNNLAIIASLLRLEQSRIDHPAARAALQDMARRVQSLALLHELLHRSRNITEVDLGAYLEQLARHVFSSLAGDAATVRLRLDLAHVPVAASPAITCGLLVNELLTNAIKHGFPGGRSGEVSVTLRAVDSTHLYLEVGDTGVGMPADFAHRRTTSMGMQLVSDLAHQLRGTFEIAPGPGAHFSLCFAIEPPHPADERAC